MNGAVERCNSACREEFYAVCELPSSVDKIDPSSTLPAPLQPPSPHGALSGLAPAQCLPKLQAKDASKALIPDTSLTVHTMNVNAHFVNTVGHHGWPDLIMKSAGGRISRMTSGRGSRR
jgi:hypothetical protein